MRLAGHFMLLSAAFHLAGVAVAAFSGEAMALLGPAAVYVLLFAGLARGWMLAAWLSFLAMIVGIAGAIAALQAPAAAPAWVFWAILASDAAAAVVLFGAIWSGRRAPGASGS